MKTKKQIILVTGIALIIGGLLGYLVGHSSSWQGIRKNHSSERGTFLPMDETHTNNPASEDFLSIRPALAALPSETLSKEEEANLVYMREEEKLARDVYQTLYDTWGTNIFSNIAQSEQTHTETIRNLLEKYNIPDPVTDDTVGVFTNPELQKLYGDLVIKGTQSELDGLIIGATIEDLDLKDLEEALIETDNADIKLVYSNLSRASRNHLRAFTKQIESRGAEYQQEYISKENYIDIVTSETERGNGARQNRGWGGK